MKRENGTDLVNLVWLLGISIFLGFFIVPSFVGAQEWPTKTITVYVGTAPGGITDLSSRVFTSEMSKILGVPIVNTNQGGGGGGIAAENTFRAPNDGYTWHAQGTAIRTYGVMGLHASAPKDWYCLPMVGITFLIAVKEDSPYKIFPDLAKALKENPGKMPYGAGMPGSAYRLAMEIMRVNTGLSARYVSYTGTATALLALLSGDVQFVVAGTGEAVELLRAKKIRALTVFEDQPYNMKDYGGIPAITDYLPQLKPYLPYRTWTSISMRADIPKPILRKVDDAFLKAAKTKSVEQYCEKFELTLMGKAGDEAQKMFASYASMEGWLLYELGIAKRNPAELMIPKP